MIDNSNNGNGNTTAYRLTKVEECCQKNTKALDRYIRDQSTLFSTTINPFVERMNALNAFINDHKTDIRDLNMMNMRIQNIESKLNTKIEKDDEKSKWTTRLLIGALVTGILTPIVMRFIGG